MYPTSSNHHDGPGRNAAMPAQRVPDPPQNHSRNTGAAGGSADEQTARPRVLVVDDAPDVTEMIGILMRHAGYDVTTALSAQEAFDAARRERFDVVVSDIGMPGMNGYQLAEALRALPQYSTVPLVAVTGFTMYDDRERARASGFDGFLTKPISPDVLLATVKRLCG